MSKDYKAFAGKPGRVVIARVKPGREIVATLTQIIEEYGIRAGYIPTFFGGFQSVTLGSMKPSSDPNHPEDIKTDYADPVDYHGTGTIARQNGNVSLHIHLSAAGGNTKATGHLFSGHVVFVTEVVIVELTDIRMERKADPDVFDLPLLEVSA